MRRARNDQRGFTLLELLIASSIFTTALIIAVSLFSSVMRSQQRIHTYTKLQGDARFVIEQIARSIRLDSIDYEWQDNIKIPDDQIATLDTNGIRRVYRSYFKGNNGTYACSGDAGVENIWVIGVCEQDTKTQSDDWCRWPADREPWRCGPHTHFTQLTPDNITIDDFFAFITPGSDPNKPPPTKNEDCATGHEFRSTEDPRESTGDPYVRSGFDATRGICTCNGRGQCFRDQECDEPWVATGFGASNDGQCRNTNKHPRATIMITSKSLDKKDAVSTTIQTTVSSRVYKR